MMKIEIGDLVFLGIVMVAGGLVLGAAVIAMVYWLYGLIGADGILLVVAVLLMGFTGAFIIWLISTIIHNWIDKRQDAEYERSNENGDLYKVLGERKEDEL